MIATPLPVPKQGEIEGFFENWLRLLEEGYALWKPTARGVKRTGKRYEALKKLFVARIKEAVGELDLPFENLAVAHLVAVYALYSSQELMRYYTPDTLLRKSHYVRYCAQIENEHIEHADRLLLNQDLTVDAHQNARPYLSAYVETVGVSVAQNDFNLKEAVKLVNVGYDLGRWREWLSMRNRKGILPNRFWSCVRKSILEKERSREAQPEDTVGFESFMDSTFGAIDWRNFTLSDIQSCASGAFLNTIIARAVAADHEWKPC